MPALVVVEGFINAHKLLPEILSEAEVKENGIEQGVINTELLQKTVGVVLSVISLKMKI